MEESLLQMICDLDRTESELKRQFKLRGQALSRIVDRARHNFSTGRPKASGTLSSDDGQDGGAETFRAVLFAEGK